MKHHDMKGYGRMEALFHPFLTLDGGEWSPSLLGRFNPERLAPIQQEGTWTLHPM